MGVSGGRVVYCAPLSAACCSSVQGAGGGDHASSVMMQIKLEKCRNEGSELGLMARKKQVPGRSSRCNHAAPWLTLPGSSGALAALSDYFA